MAVEASGEVIFLTDPDGTITYVNPEFVRVYGYAATELVGRSTPRILKSGTTSAEEYSSFWQQLRKSEVVRREFVNRKKDGTTVQIEGSANPIVMDDRSIATLASGCSNSPQPPLAGRPDAHACSIVRADR